MSPSHLTEEADSSWSIVQKIRQSPPVDLTKPYDTATLSGKSILITGGASGFGAAFARHWARHGAHIFIGDVNDAAGEELVAELRAISSEEAEGAGRNCQHFYFHCDVTSWDDQVRLFKSAIAASPTKGIDCVVAGAGIVDLSSAFDEPKRRIGADDDEPAEPKLKVVEVNLKGVMYTTHLALYYLPKNGTRTRKRSRGSNGIGREEEEEEEEEEQGRGGGQARDRHVLLVSSIAGLLPLPSQTEYTASKHAVMGVFRSLRGTSWCRGVRVNVINPYFVETPLLTGGALALLAGAPKGQVEDVVDAATRLVADEGIVGRALVIGPKMRVVDGEDGLPKLEVEAGAVADAKRDEPRTQAVWEVYGHDYEKVETFVWRFITMLNAVKATYGWVRTAKEWWRIFRGTAGRRGQDQKNK